MNVTEKKIKRTADMVKAITGKCEVYVEQNEITFVIGMAWGQTEEAKMDKAFNLICARLGSFDCFWRGQKRRISVCGDSNVDRFVKRWY